MPAIELNQQGINSRGTEISRFLRQLSRTSHGPASEKRPIPGAIVIGTHEGGPAQSDYREWRFATCIPGFWANYYEVWSPIDLSHQQFFLEKAYLTIYRKDKNIPPNYEQFVCLHCDPNETDINGTNTAIYKKGPHLHIMVAEEPIPKAHLALARGNLQSVLSNERSLTEALKWSIQLIKDEILDRVQTS